MDTPAYTRLNIYLDDPDLRKKVRMAAARQGVSLSAYCLEAIRYRLAEEGFLPAPETEGMPHPGSPQHAAQALDRLRLEIGRLGVPVSDLIAKGRRR